MSRATVLVTLTAIIGIVALACSKKNESSAESAGESRSDHVVMGEFVNPGDSLPRLRFFDDGQVSLNDRCAVRKVKLNPKMPAVYVNGQPVGFC